jgi:hypothetical protein
MGAKKFNPIIIIIIQPNSLVFYFFSGENCGGSWQKIIALECVI